MVQYYQYPYVSQQPVTVYPQVNQIPVQQIPIQGTELSGIQQITVGDSQGIQLPFIETSYIENILRLNLGKLATVYMNFENSQWSSKIFKGIIEAAGKDHIILSDPQTGMRYLLLTIYLNYITFDEELNYEYPFDDLVQEFQPQQTQQSQQFQQPIQPTQQSQQSQQPQQFTFQQPQAFQRKKDKKNGAK